MSVRVLHHVFEHSEATGNDRVVLLVLADHAHDDGRSAYPSQARIAKKARCSKRTVHDCLTRLQELGELRKLSVNEKTQTVIWQVVMKTPAAEGTDAESATPPPQEGEQDLQSRIAGLATGGTQDSQGGSADGCKGGMQPAANEPSVNRQGTPHTARESIEVPAEVLDAITAVAELKRHPVPAAKQIAEVLLEYADRDHLAEAERFRRYYLAGKGRARSMADVVAAWDRWLKGADPMPTPRHLRPVPGARAFDDAAVVAARAKWNAALADLAERVSPSALESWIEPLEPLGLEDGVLYIRAPQRAREWFDRRYGSLIEATTDCKVKLAA